MNRKAAPSDLAEIITGKPNAIIRWGVTLFWGIAALCGVIYYLVKQ